MKLFLTWKDDCDAAKPKDTSDLLVLSHYIRGKTEFYSQCRFNRSVIDRISNRRLLNV